MKDTQIKYNGKSRRINAPYDMPGTYAEWRNAAINGMAFMDIAVNTDTEGEDAGCDVIGTPLNKVNLLDDSTQTALGLTGDDPTVNDALSKLAESATGAMMKSGGAFTGDVTAYSTNRITSCLRNIEVRSVSDTGELQSTDKIIMVRK